MGRAWIVLGWKTSLDRECGGEKFEVESCGTGSSFDARSRRRESYQLPFALLASADEDKEAVERFGANLMADKLLETFDDMSHGWMGARLVISAKDPRTQVLKLISIIEPT